MSGMPTTNFNAPILSPSLNEFSEATVVDENSNQLEVFAAVQLDSSAHSNLGTASVGKGHASQVTGRQQSAVVTTPSGAKIRLAALVSLDSAGNPIPFVAASSSKVTGKFQSTVQTGNGSAQSIAHGLGVVPSLVLIAPYNVPSAEAFAIAEGTHTTTNVVVTVTTGVQYKVIAFV